MKLIEAEVLGMRERDSKNMMVNQSRDKILELLMEDGSAKVVSLAKIFRMSEVTIRQDLEKFKKDGLVMKTEGTGKKTGIGSFRIAR